MTNCFMNNEFLPQMSCTNVAVLGWGRHPGPAGDRAMTRVASKRVTPQDVSDRVPMNSVPCCYSALRSAGSSHSNYLVCDILRYQPHHFDVVTKYNVLQMWCCCFVLMCKQSTLWPTCIITIQIIKKKSFLYNNFNMKMCSHYCEVRFFFLLNYRTGHLCCIKKTCEQMSEKSLARSVSLRFCKRLVTLKSSEIKIKSKTYGFWNIVNLVFKSIFWKENKSYLKKFIRFSYHDRMTEKEYFNNYKSRYEKRFTCKEIKAKCTFCNFYF